MAKPKKPTTYKDSGVNIDAGNSLVDKIEPLAKKTARPEVLSPLGGYAGLFALDLKKYKNPVLVSSTDGVGTKLKLAFELEIFDTVGTDLVAMSVNDLICCGAEPLFFLDYFATGKLKADVAEKVIWGITQSLKEINCTLLGGETAEMPDFYQKGEFDLAGFAVGVVEKDKIIDETKTEIGDRIIGLASSGVHSNGFSLVRKILKDHKINLKKELLGFERSIGLELLTPTKIYVNQVLKLLENFSISGLAHITGGGIVENLPRVFPSSMSAEIEKEKIDTPRIFAFLQEMGKIPEDEMWRVFNMGVGFVLIVKPDDEKPIIDELKKMNTPANTIGTIVERKKGRGGVSLV